jgi:hypothetical protein
MQTLERRITDLESRTHSKQYDIVVRFIGPGEIGKELMFLSDHDGNEWSRHSGESEDDFRARAFAGCKRNSFGVVRLFSE